MEPCLPKIEQDLPKIEQDRPKIEQVLPKIEHDLTRPYKVTRVSNTVYLSTNIYLITAQGAKKETPEPSRTKTLFSPKKIPAIVLEFILAQPH